MQLASGAPDKPLYGAEKQRPPLRRWIWLAALGALVAAAGCERRVASGEEDLASIRARGELVVVTRAAPTTFYQGGHGPQGPEFDMVEDFARHLGVRTRYLVASSVTEALHWLDRGQADLAAAGISRTPSREARFRFGPVYRHIEQQVVCHRDGPRPARVADLVGLRLRVGRDTSHEERLQSIAAAVPGLRWDAADGESAEQLLERVWRREIDCTVVDSLEVAVQRRFMPELDIAFDLSGREELSWVLPKRSAHLAEALEGWMQGYRDQGLLAAQEERYFGHLDAFDYLDVTTYRGRIFTRLPRYRTHFRRAEARYDLPWTLLAAVAYHESHWDPAAVSPTGVRGLMMLTSNTARSLGVDRLDPAQSIQGAARYLTELRDSLPQQIPEPDRTWMALAAYNVGLGHLQDARALAEHLQLDPNRWTGVKQAFPLLSKRAYARHSRFGYSQGDQPVRYVERVRNLHAVLNQAYAEQGPYALAGWPGDERRVAYQ
ncbi:MAG TPA: membrane-bound lytic murein transglycosylase MltF [Candidatus Macondimonas sp.]|nr:membrane-bound lytic murein transglycosylase MltF [Candidatus Macondimonas sp.]